MAIQLIIAASRRLWLLLPQPSDDSAQCVDRMISPAALISQLWTGDADDGNERSLKCPEHAPELLRAAIAAELMSFTRMYVLMLPVQVRPNTIYDPQYEDVKPWTVDNGDVCGLHADFYGPLQANELPRGIGEQEIGANDQTTHAYQSSLSLNRCASPTWRTGKRRDTTLLQCKK